MTTRLQVPAIKAALDQAYAKAAEAQAEIKRLTVLLIEAAGGTS